MSLCSTDLIFYIFSDGPRITCPRQVYASSSNHEVKVSCNISANPPVITRRVKWSTGLMPSRKKSLNLYNYTTTIEV